MNREPAIVITYTDSEEHFNGWLVIDGGDHPLSAGGMRVQKGLTLGHLKKMARNMSKKMRLCDLPVNGAKSGIDYDPSSKGKKKALDRFLKAISPLLKEGYSMGADLNTTMDELNGCVEKLGLPSIKYAVQKAQGYTPEYFKDRLDVLKKPAIGRFSLGDIRSGFGVGMSAIKMVEYLNMDNTGVSVLVQGFGELAKAAIATLLENGLHIKGVSDINQCMIAKESQPLPVIEWLSRLGTTLPVKDVSDGCEILSSAEILTQSCDVLVLAAIENVITKENAKDIKAKVIVPGANLAVSAEAEEILFDRGITVLPCFVAGCGGTMSMNGLFGFKDHPDPMDVLGFMEREYARIIREVMDKSRAEKIPPTKAADEMIIEKKIPNRELPYEVTR